MIISFRRLEISGSLFLFLILSSRFGLNHLPGAILAIRKNQQRIFRSDIPEYQDGGHMFPTDWVRLEYWEGSPLLVCDSGA